MLAGCGSAGVGELPPAAEPARSPEAAERPAGRAVAIGPSPEGVVVDPVTGIVAVGLRGRAELARVDGRSGRILSRVAIPASPRHLTLAGPGGPFLVPAEAAERLTRVPARRGRVTSIRVGGHPHDATVAGGRVFVADGRTDTVSVVDAGRVTRRLAVAAQPGGLATLDDGRAVAVVSMRARSIDVYDAATLDRRGRLPAGVGPTHVASNGRDTLWVVDTDGGALLVYRLRTELTFLRRYELGDSPYGIAVDRERARLWVTLTAENALLELTSGTRPYLVRRFPAVRQPNTVAVDERTGRVFVTGMTAGALQLLDPPRRR